MHAHEHEHALTIELVFFVSILMTLLKYIAPGPRCVYMYCTLQRPVLLTLELSTLQRYVLNMDVSTLHHRGMCCT
jgi:hypothetical protein